MLSTGIRRLAHFSMAMLLALGPATGTADDTEIYFSSGSSSGNQDSPLIPNVLFILDTSISMAGTRIADLRSAMDTIIRNVEDVNLGIMRFTYNDGGSVIYPISYIDGEVTDVVSEAGAAAISYSGSANTSLADTEEDKASTVVIVDDHTLEIGVQAAVAASSTTKRFPVVSGNDDAEEDCCGQGRGNMNRTSIDVDMDGNEIGAFRFPNVTIPKNANITAARLEFALAENLSSTSVRQDIYVQQTDNASSIGGGDDDITNRSYYNLKVDWTPVGPTGPAGNYVSTDSQTATGNTVRDLVQTVVNRNGWVSGNAMLFRMNHDNGTVRLLTKEGADGNAAYDSDDYPTLHVTYGAAAIPAIDQKVAIRFENVKIPRGAAISDARLVFTPAASDSSTAEWTIKAENVDNSPALAATSANISGRTSLTSGVTWSVPNWTANSTSTSVDLTSIVGAVTGRTGWCGGNAITFIIEGTTGMRRAKSADSGADGPVFQYSYVPSPSDGCIADSDQAQVSASANDAEQTISDGSINRTSSYLQINSTQWIGLRFTNVQVPQGATITNAYLRLRANQTQSSSIQANIYAENAADANSYSTSTNNISSRAKFATPVNWTPTAWTSGTFYNSDSIASLVQQVVALGGWVSGNDMGFMITGTGAGERSFVSYDSDANNGARLVIEYQVATGTPVKTNRARMLELVADLPATDYTPLVEVMYEAAHYWRGGSVVYGKDRNGSASARISHAGSYCHDENDCNGANTGTYPPYGVDTPTGCNMLVNPNSSNCVNEEIKGSPNYISPFSSTLSCARNYQVLLTDGAANSSSDTVRNAIRSELLSNASCLATNRGNNAYDSSEQCGVDVAKALYENDQSSLDNDQNVITYTVAFNLSDTGAVQFLKDMTYYGNGGTEDGFYSTTNADGLVEVFETILTDVKRDPTSFVAPSLATNAFNRLLSRDEVYFGLFTPSLDKAWYGNVKKYGICVDSNGPDGINGNADDCELGAILDYQGNDAIGSDSKFLESARSFWSDLTDGRATTKGGSGGQMLDWQNRKIYTEGSSAPAAGTALNGTGHLLDKDTWDDAETDFVRAIICPTNSTDTGTAAGQDCQKRWRFMLGMIADPDPDNDASTANNTRWSINDVLHSSPSVITYGGSGSTFFDKLVFGTNGGGVAFVNAGNTANGGNEEWYFLPTMSLDNQQQLFTNPEGDHIYGMDLTPTIRVIDNDRDGNIEPATPNFDKVQVFMGMRRGGNLIYALDVSGTAQITGVDQPIVPKFLWRIQGGSGTFARLGYTFSQPRLATIRVTNAADAVISKQVLVFGGGYDVALDNGFGTTPTSGANNMGNALYIVDPDDGSLILSLAGDDGNAGTQLAQVEVPNMKYSVPGRISVLDSDGDGIDDRLYFGDTGGQVWRVDLAADIKPSAGSPGSTIIGRLANVSDPATTAQQRRFFEPPSIVQVRDTLYSNISEYDYVLIGSGNRAHPLNKDVDDRFYAFRDRTIGTMPDTDGNNLADASYPAGTTAGAPINGAGATTDLINVTTSVLSASNTTHDAALGWYFDFTASGNDGEKVLSAPLTLAGTVFFTTYQPDAVSNVDACSSNVGGGNAYNFDILSAAATLDWDLDNTVDGVTDRSRALGGGIPSDVVPVFTKEGIVGIVGIEGGAAQLGTLSALPRFKTYWYREKRS